MLVISELLLTKAVSKGIHDRFRLTAIGCTFRPQLNSELPLLLLNWRGYISCQHFKMTFLLKNKNFPDKVPWVPAEPDTGRHGPALSLWGGPTARLALGLPATPACDSRQLQRNPSDEGKRKKN